MISRQSLERPLMPVEESDELFDDSECIQGLEAVGSAIQMTRQSFERTYRFPQQETRAPRWQESVR